MSEMKGSKNDRRDNDLISVEEICSSTWENIYRFIYFKVQNREEAEDITQETYAKAYPYLRDGNVRPEQCVGFLKTIALNALRDLWRKKSKRKWVDLDAIDPKVSAIDDETELSVQRMMIKKALRQLSEEQRSVIELRVIKGYSVADTAKRMNKKEGAIRVAQYRALKKLNEILKALEKEDETDGRR